MYESHQQSHVLLNVTQHDCTDCSQVATVSQSDQIKTMTPVAGHPTFMLELRAQNNILAVSMISVYCCYRCNPTVPHHLPPDFNQSSRRRCTNKQNREKTFTTVPLMYMIYLQEGAIKDPTVFAGVFSCEVKEAPWLRSFSAGLTLCYV